MSFGVVASAVAGPLIGGLLGSESSGSSTQQATQSRNPWEPAQPFLLKDLQTNQDLQDWYTQNPFNAQQQTGLQNTLGDANHFRANIMPGLMDFANRGMTSSYQRQTGGAPGSGGGYGGAVRPGGLLQSGQGPFSAPTGGLFGAIDWKAMSPAAPSQNSLDKVAPNTYQAGQSENPVWEAVLGDFNASHQSRYGIPMNRPWTSDTDAQRSYAGLQEEYGRRRDAELLKQAAPQAPLPSRGGNPFTNGYMGDLAGERKVEADKEAKRLKAEKELEALQRNPFNSDYGS